jgi:hypothetical protein
VITVAAEPVMPQLGVAFEQPLEPRETYPDRSDPAHPARDRARFVTVRGTQLGHRVGEVVAHGARGERRAVGDLVDRGATRGQFNTSASRGVSGLSPAAIASAANSGST